jgi:hypothetical protein
MAKAEGITIDKYIRTCVHKNNSIIEGACQEVFRFQDNLSIDLYRKGNLTPNASLSLALTANLPRANMRAHMCIKIS